MKARKENIKKGYALSRKDSLSYYIRKPAGCAACGNPAYPECKYSFPLFDDEIINAKRPLANKPGAVFYGPKTWVAMAK